MPLAYRGNFFLSEPWFKVLADTTDVSPVMLKNSNGAIPCRKRGPWLSSLTNFYSMEYAPVGDFEPLLADTGCMFDMQFVKDPAVEKRIQDQGYQTFRQHQYANWTCPIDSDFATYFKARPSQLQNTVKRKSKALNKEHEVQLLVEREASPFLWSEVYDNSWRAKPEPYQGFMPALLLAAEKLGILRQGFACIDGEVAASQVWFVESGRAVIYKLAYKEKFKDTSIGSILSHEMFRAAIDEDKVTLIDYGVGDEPYKRDWMTHRGEVYQLTCFDRSWRGKALAFAKRLKAIASSRSAQQPPAASA